MSATSLLAVALGGALGAVLRYLVAFWLAAAAARGEVPWGTLVVNFAGTALLAWLTASSLAGRGLGEAMTLFIGPGLCGALTTFSTVAVEVVMLVRAGATATALGYATFSVVGAIAIVAAIFSLVGVARP